MTSLALDLGLPRRHSRRITASALATYSISMATGMKDLPYTVFAYPDNFDEISIDTPSSDFAFDSKGNTDPGFTAGIGTNGIPENGEDYLLLHDTADSYPINEGLVPANGVKRIIVGVANASKIYRAIWRDLGTIEPHEHGWNIKFRMCLDLDDDEDLWCSVSCLIQDKDKNVLNFIILSVVPTNGWVDAEVIVRGDVPPRYFHLGIGHRDADKWGYMGFGGKDGTENIVVEERAATPAGVISTDLPTHITLDAANWKQGITASDTSTIAQIGTRAVTANGGVGDPAIWGARTADAPETTYSGFGLSGLVSGLPANTKRLIGGISVNAGTNKNLYVYSDTANLATLSNNSEGFEVILAYGIDRLAGNYSSFNVIVYFVAWDAQGNQISNQILDNATSSDVAMRDAKVVIPSVVPPAKIGLLLKDLVNNNNWFGQVVLTGPSTDSQRRIIVRPVPETAGDAVLPSNQLKHSGERVIMNGYRVHYEGVENA